MFGLNDNVRYFMCQHPVRMNKGIDALFNLIKAESPLSPMNGDIYIFFGQNRQNVKILKWDTDGFLLYHKRLERGSFELPKIDPATGYYELFWETFSFIVSGLSLDSVRFRKRYRILFLSI
ncbi:IS66 family insertion sequence element accessory protein TnpB [Bacteroides reticulotermitis]|nr:IS66 family insertion sequence element accessory protein TnpB [Bacteroides reticulotermitis]